MFSNPNLNIKVDNNSKKEVKNLFNKPSKKLIRALKEAKKIANDSKRKGYQNVDDLMKALLKN